MEKDVPSPGANSNLEEVDKQLQEFLGTIDFDILEPTEIIFDDEQRLKAASLAQLVCAITDPQTTGMIFVYFCARYISVIAPKDRN
jgi:hypothetical protein